MADQFVHLRNADTDGDIQWDPSASSPNFSGMDNFCFSCHDTNGATSPGVKAIQTAISSANGSSHARTPARATAGNPFGDQLTNKYDQITRAQVVDVYSAMDPANASHHAVRKAKYKTRSTATAISNGDMVTGQHTLFDGASGNSALTSLFVSDYTPLGAGVSVGDDSQLHCGDCHTVGQWKNDNTKYNQAAIGAHGSNNEYMLRNNLGSDALHNGTTYVCFNCHNDKAGTSNAAGGYYAAYNAAGVSGGSQHMNGIHTGTNGCLQNTAGNVGTAQTAVSGGQMQFDPTGRLGGNMFQLNNTGAAVSKGNVAGNITGIACTNCHNAGLKSGLGGIHGGNQTYSSKAVGTAPASATQPPYRFMSGMGNFAYTPAGNDMAGAVVKGQPTASTTGTCYTNTNTTDNAGYSSCNHHGTGTAITRTGGTVGNVARPLSY
jgi:hypothetical protein